MGGKMSAAYWREYRLRRRTELREWNRAHRAQPAVRAQRRAAEARRRARRREEQAQPLPLLYPGLQRGSRVSFWEDELKLDLVQERHLAVLEGRDPDAAVRAYRARETRWRAVTCPLLVDGEAAA